MSTVHVDETFAMGVKRECDKRIPEPARSCQQPRVVVAIRILPISPRLECRGIDDINSRCLLKIPDRHSVPLMARVFLQWLT